MTRNPVGDNEPFSAAYWSAILNAHDFEYVHDGIAPSKGTGNFDVDTTAGNVQVNATKAAVAAQVTTLSAADATNPRVDLIVCDGTGDVTAVTGTAAADPVAPDIPADRVLIAAVFVPAGAASITAGDIYDYRNIGAFEDYPITSADVQDGTLQRADLGFTTSDPLYGDGADGAVTRSLSANENGVIRATDYTVDAGVTMTVTTGALLVLAKNSITINGTITANGFGALGSNGSSGSSSNAPDAAKGAAGIFTHNQVGGAGGGGGGGFGGNGGAGGDGDLLTPERNKLITSGVSFIEDVRGTANGAGAGGGGGGGASTNATSGQNGVNGSFPGGGGGGGANGNSDSGAKGGNGGGIVALIAPSITVAGAVTCNGQDGASKATGDGGAGGGGTGGVVALYGASITTTGTLSAAAGLGGTAAGRGGDGANGADGVVRTVTV